MKKILLISIGIVITLFAARAEIVNSGGEIVGQIKTKNCRTKLACLLARAAACQPTVGALTAWSRPTAEYPWRDRYTMTYAVKGESDASECQFRYQQTHRRRDFAKGRPARFTLVTGGFRCAADTAQELPEFFRAWQRGEYINNALAYCDYHNPESGAISSATMYCQFQNIACRVTWKEKSIQ